VDQSALAGEVRAPDLLLKREWLPIFTGEPLADAMQWLPVTTYNCGRRSPRRGFGRHAGLLRSSLCRARAAEIDGEGGSSAAAATIPANILIVLHTQNMPALGGLT
jgi:hypothetical protein